MKHNKKVLIAILFLVLISLPGVSYAFFASSTQKSGNDKINEITTEELGNIKWEGTKVYESGNSLPGEIGIQTFKVSKNSDTGKGIYEIDLEGIIDEAFNNDVLISLYKSTDPDKNYVKVKEGESTITGDDDTKMYYKEDKLEAVGTPELVYGPRALETKDPIILYQADFDNTNFPETTFYLVYEYLNKDNQDLEQGKSFSGTIKVRLILEKITGEESDIDITYTSNRNQYVNTDEALEITATSEKYNIARYSFDNIIYTPVDSPNKTVTITKAYTEEKDSIVYFKDNVGNTKSKKLDLWLDKTGPSIVAKTTEEWDKTNTISIALEDEKSGLAGYNIVENEVEPKDWIKVDGKSANVTKEVTSNKKYYIYAKDVLGNISHKDVEVSHVDETAPVINDTQEQKNYGATSVITVSVKDNETGIAGYAFTSTNEEPTEWTSVDNVITESTYTYKASSNGTIYFWVKDRVGNITSKRIKVTKVDTISPIVHLELTDEETWTQSKTLTMTFNDIQSGLASYKVSTSLSDSAKWSRLGGTLAQETQTITSNGTYYVCVRDEVGLESCASKTISYIDPTPPISSMTLTKTDDSITVDASTSSDNESGIISYEYSLDDASYYTSSESIYTFTGLDAGIYTVYLRVKDMAGNVDSTNSEIVILPDVSGEKVTNGITTLSNYDKKSLALDGYGNTRYVGANPNNYINIDGDIWRIIGVMKDIDDGTGVKEDRVKIIRSESIGDFAWDTSSRTSVNDGYGVNEWSQAAIMKLLNPGYDDEYVGGSLYWNKSSGRCYSSESYITASCDFTTTGANDKLKELIGDAVWNTGSQGTSKWTVFKGGLSKHFYTYERSNNTGKICPNSGVTAVDCNDTVERKTEWVGKIGLMYPSDYGYATSGSDFRDRDRCLSIILANWSNSEIPDCRTNDWLYSGKGQFTMTPAADSTHAYYIFYLTFQGMISTTHTSYRNETRPTAYLKSSVKIASGSGSQDDPFVLEN